MNTAIPKIPGSLSVTDNAASKPKDLSAQEDDTRVEKAGGSVVIDPMSVQYLVGAEIDHQEGLGVRNLCSTIPTRGPRAGGASFSNGIPILIT